MDPDVPRSDFHDDVALRLMYSDESVLADILGFYGPPLEKVIVLRFKRLSIEDAEEIVSDAVFRLWQHREHYDPDKASVRTLLYRIADNKAKDVLALGWQQARKRESEADPEFLNNLAAPDQETESRTTRIAGGLRKPP